MVKVAATQFACSWDTKDNIKKAEGLVREAAALGAQIILLQELFEAPYFCRYQRAVHHQLARPLAGSPLVEHFVGLAKELGVVLPISFYEAAGNARYNSIVVIDTDGTIIGPYRKVHIPDGPGYSEKFYFKPGDLGFKVFKTSVATIGVAICWDQWFPEAARAMVLAGAQILFYPTAIGSEPPDPTADTRDHWRTAMFGHSASNVVPVVASNRIGREADEDVVANLDHLTTNADFPAVALAVRACANANAARGGAADPMAVKFYGSSFITNHTGAMIADATRDKQEVLVADVDITAADALRVEWGIFRDRRPDAYVPLMTADGYTIDPAVVAGVAARGAAAASGALPTLAETAVASVFKGPARTAASGGVISPVRVPWEGETVKRMWFIWPENPETWYDIEATRKAFANVAKAINDAGVPMGIVASEGVVGTIDPYLTAAGAKTLGEGTALVVCPTGDSWARDSLPTFAKVGTANAAIGWTYNGYGGLYTGWEKDKHLGGHVAKACAVPLLPSHLTTEGGALEFDGDGTVIVTESSILGQKHNPGWSPDTIEDELRARAGVRRVVWLQKGLAHDGDTDGHVDNLCRVVAPGVVALAWTDNPAYADYPACRDCEEILLAANFKVIRIESPSVFVEEGVPADFRFPIGKPLSASYLNFAIVNDIVIVPTFGGVNTERDAKALKAIGDATQRKAVSVLANSIVTGGGGIHCILQHEFE